MPIRLPSHVCVLFPAILAVASIPMMPAASRAAPDTVKTESNCGASTGKVIFEDSFKDTTGGWDEDDSAVFGKPALSLTLGADESRWTYVNPGFDAINANYCLEAIVPKAVAKGNDAAVGLIFLYKDDDDYFKLQIFSDGTVSLVRIAKGDASDLLDQTVDAVKAPPGSVAVLRAVIENGLLTASVNGVVVKKIRVQVPDGTSHFGVEAHTDEKPGKPFRMEFRRIRVTGAS